MTITPGTRLGPYEVTALLGEGGMGQVWRAKDTSLGRQVAIKILPEAFAADPDRLARFEREAKTLASLNHPHIAAIYAVEKSGGALALVMELVEGDDLSQRIARGAIPIDEALPIAKQIAEALEAAHEQGIIHRDLKPANIKVRPDGTVKVLDFGLAKAMEPAAASSAEAMNSPTLSIHATQAGVILGTAAYMAPEQAKGRPVDRRADVWAFGAVLYEMLTGTRAFPGGDVSEVLASVLAREPDWARLPAVLSPVLATYIRRCLQKNPKQRIGDVQDVRLALEGAFETAAPQATASASAVRPLWRRVLPVAAAVALTAALAALVAVWQWRPASAGAPAEALRASLLFPDGAGPSSDGGLALSPDGSRLAFVSLASVDGQRIWIRPLAGGDDRPLSGTEGAADPAWSPDGSRIAFHVDNREIRVVPADGGPVVPVASNPLELGMPTWDADGGILFYAGDSVWRVPDRGGPPSALVKVSGEGFQAASTRVESLPNGGGLLIGSRNTAGRGGGSGIFAIDVGTGESAPLVEGAQQPHYVDGWLLFGVGQTAATVFAQRFDVDTRALRGPPMTVANGVAKPGGRTQLAVSRHTLVYSPGSVSSLDRDGSDLLWLDSAGKLTPAVPGGVDGWIRDLSPDGTTIASGGFGLTVVGTQGGLPRRLEGAGAAVANFPRWSRDGKTLLYASGDLRSITTTPGDTSKLLVPQPEAGEFLSVGWGPSGEVLFVQRFPDGKSELKALDASGTTRTVQPGAEDASLSPDGSWLAYVSAQGSRRPPEVFVRAYPGTAEVRVSMDGGLRPTWGPDGRALYFLTRRGKAQRVVLSFAGGSITASRPSDLAGDLPSLDLAAAHPDGRILLHSRVQAADALTLIRDWQALAREGR